jgi:hypothetical protein
MQDAGMGGGAASGAGAAASGAGKAGGEAAKAIKESMKKFGEKFKEFGKSVGQKTKNAFGNMNNKTKYAAGGAAVGGAGGFLLGRGVSGGGKIKGDVSRGSVWLFFIISLTIHLLDYWANAFSTYMRWMLYIALGFFAAVMFKNSVNKIYEVSLGFTLANLFMPLVIRNVPRDMSVYIYLVVLVLPLWFLFIWWNFKDDIRFIGIVGTIWFLICLLLVINSFVAENPAILSADFIPSDSAEAIRLFTKELKNWFSNVKGQTFEVVTSLPDTLKRTWNQSMTYATGGYYNGQEEAVQEPLGVFLEDIEATSEKYYEGDKITIWGVLRARNIGRKPMDVDVNCGLAEEWQFNEEEFLDRGYQKPQAYPSEFQMEGYDRVNIDCAFNKGFPVWGKYDVMINATFSFETNARLLTYWMDLNSARAITREGEKIHRVYDIPEEPVSYYTSGPVMVGMNMGKQPIRVGGENQDRPILGITVKSNGDRGKIAKIHFIEIYIPKEISINTASCSEKVAQIKTEGEFKVYRVESDRRFENIENYHTITCGFEELSNSVLEPTAPITLRYIKSKISYDYVVYRSIKIDVEEDPNKEEIEEESSSNGESGDGTLKSCYGVEDGYKYACVPMNVPNSCSGEWSTRQCPSTKPGTRCCKTEV